MTEGDNTFMREPQEPKQSGGLEFKRRSTAQNATPKVLEGNRREHTYSGKMLDWTAI